MADHYVSINRGVEGSKSSDFTTGTSPNSGAMFELRVFDAVAVTDRPTELEVLKALEAFKRFFETSPLAANAGFVVRL